MSNDKIRVMIIDDEHHIRKLLKNSVDWTSFNMEIINEASTANEAFAFIEKEIPDIIITDICMPLIDGLEFSEEITKKYPNIKIVVLTGYSNFDYAKKAIKIGVSGFILKPINDDEIVQLLLKLKKTIEEENVKSSEFNNLKIQIQQDLPYLQERIFERIIKSENFDVHKSLEKAKQYSITLNENYLKIVVIDFLYPFSFEKEQVENNYEIKQQAFQTIKDKLENIDDIFCINIKNNKCVLFINNKMERLTPFCEEIRQEIDKKYGIYVNIGISTDYYHISEAKKAYKEAVLACDYRLIRGNNQTVYFDEVDLFITNTTNLIKMLENYNYAVKAGLIKESINAIEQCFKKININNGVKDIMAIASNIILTIVNICEEMNIESDAIFRNAKYPFDVISRIETIPRMEDYINNLTKLLILEISMQKDKDKLSVVKKAKVIINNEYSNQSLSLSYIAEMLFVNPSYLSRVFKKESGKNFTAYILNVRIEKAVELAQNTELKAYEIAEKIGFSNEYYFSTCFKKQTGIAFSKFR